MIKRYRFIIIGVIAGAFLTFFPAGSFVFMLFALSVYCINRFARTPARGFLLKIFIAGFILRILLSFANHYAASIGPYKATDTQADAVIFNGNAFYIAHVLRGNDYPERTVEAMRRDPFLRHSIRKGYHNFSGGLPSIHRHQYNAYTFFLGILYAWLGYAPIAAKILNGLFGCLSAIWAYYIATILTKSEKAAKISAVLVMFFPSFVYWSVTLLQDLTANSLFLLYVMLLLIYLRSGKKTSLVLAAVTCFCLGLFETRILPILAAWLVLVLIVRFLKDAREKRILAGPVLLLAVLMAAAFIYRPMITDHIKDGLNFISDYRQASIQFHPSASIFNIDDDHAQGGSIFKMLAYYFLSPFPWRSPYPHLFLLPFYPQAVFTLICIPFALLGIFTGIRRDPYLTLTLALLLVLIILPQAMAERIVGNVVRHRDMFMPFVFIFSSYGFCLAVMPGERAREGRG